MGDKVPVMANSNGLLAEQFMESLKHQAKNSSSSIDSRQIGDLHTEVNGRCRRVRLSAICAAHVFQLTRELRFRSSGETIEWLLRHEVPSTSDATNTDTMAHPDPVALPLKIITGADSFGTNLKDMLVAELQSRSIEVEDLGTSKYYSTGEEVGHRVSQAAQNDSAVETRGLVAYRSGVGVSIFANTFPGVYAALCLNTADAVNARSINNSNVLAIFSASTAPEAAKEILKTFLEMPFKSPCLTSGDKLWPEDIQSFLDNSIHEMSSIGTGNIPASAAAPCFIGSEGYCDGFGPKSITPATPENGPKFIKSGWAGNITLQEKNKSDVESVAVVGLNIQVGSVNVVKLTESEKNDSGYSTVVLLIGLLTIYRILL